MKAHEPGAQLQQGNAAPQGGEAGRFQKPPYEKPEFLSLQGAQLVTQCDCCPFCGAYTACPAQKD